MIRGSSFGLGGVSTGRSSSTLLGSSISRPTYFKSGSSSSNSDSCSINLCEDFFTSNLRLKRELYKYDKFYEYIIKHINEYLNYLRIGDFDSLSEEMQSDFFVNLGQIIIDDKFFSPKDVCSLQKYNYDYENFKLYKRNAHKILDGLYKIIRLNNEKNSFYTTSQKYREILYDREALKEFIEKNYNEKFLLFDVGASLEETPTIKPQYLLYIQRHGFPPGGSFESELMSEIIKELIENGELEQIDLDNYLMTLTTAVSSSSSENCTSSSSCGDETSSCGPISSSYSDCLETSSVCSSTSSSCSSSSSSSSSCSSSSECCVDVSDVSNNVIDSSNNVVDTLNDVVDTLNDVVDTLNDVTDVSNDVV